MIYEFFKTSAIFVAVVSALIGAGVGVVKAIDYIEENPHAAKSKIQMVVYGVVVAHIYLLITGVSIFHIIFSLVIQYTFNTFFSTYPIVKPEDPRFIFGVIASFVNHFLMIKHFFSLTPTIFSVIISFAIIWITPFCFFFSMSASEDTLFASGSGKKGGKTYAGIALDWVLKLGKKPEKNKN